MPAAVVAIAGVVGSVAGAVASVAAGVGGIIVSAVGTVVSLIGKTVGGLVGGISSLAKGVGDIVSGIGKGILEPAAAGIKNLSANLTTTVKDISGKLTTAIQNLKTAITKPLEPILGPIKETLEVVKTTVDAIKAPVEAILEPVAEIRKTIQDISELKVLGELLTGTGKVSDLLGKVAEGKGESTAAAIAQLLKTITTTSVTLLDKVKTEAELTRATIATFDERLESRLKEFAHTAKAELMALVTPKLDILGEHSLKVTREVARLARHIEDEGWFAAMLLRVLR